MLSQPTASPYLLSPPPHHAQLLHPAHLASNPLALAGSVPGAGAPMNMPFSMPPPNSALLAQQQAHFIAQQTLLARQQAAAAHAGAEHNVPWQHFMNPYLSIPQNPHNPFAANHGAPPQSPFLFMQRPFLPMAVISSQGYHAQAAAAAAATATTASPSTNTNQTAVKRSYDNAFQTEPSSVTASKRTLTNVYNYYNAGV